MDKLTEEITPQMWNMENCILTLGMMVVNRQITPTGALYVIKGMNSKLFDGDIESYKMFLTEFGVVLQMIRIDNMQKTEGIPDYRMQFSPSEMLNKFVENILVGEDKR